VRGRRDAVGRGRQKGMLLGFRGLAVNPPCGEHDLYRLTGSSSAQRTSRLVRLGRALVNSGRVRPYCREFCSGAVTVRAVWLSPTRCVNRGWSRKVDRSRHRRQESDRAVGRMPGWSSTSFYTKAVDQIRRLGSGLLRAAEPAATTHFCALRDRAVLCISMGKSIPLLDYRTVRISPPAGSGR
jgi:hypothetical protein